MPYEIGEVIIDEPLKIGSKFKRSLFNQHSRVAVNDIEAIGRSSNVYMFKIAIAIANANYRYGGALSIDKKAFDTLRQLLRRLV